MNDFAQAGLTVIAGIITLATISVIVGSRSNAPAAIQAGGSALANIVGSAVNPVGNSANNGNLALNPFSMPSSQLTGLATNLLNGGMI